MFKMNRAPTTVSIPPLRVGRQRGSGVRKRKSKRSNKRKTKSSAKRRINVSKLIRRILRV